MARDYLQEAGDVIFKGSLPASLAVLAAKDPGQVIANLLRALNADQALSSTMIRKAAAYALGQIGEPSTATHLSTRYRIESAPGVKDALAASITAINVAGGPAHSQIERRQIIEDVYNRKRPPQFEIERQPIEERRRAPDGEDYVRHCRSELEGAPPLFKAAFRQLSEGDLEKAASTFSGCVIAGGEQMTDEWAATAMCYAAHCAAELGSFEEAISMAEGSMKIGFLLNGRFYYYSAMWTALNQLDRLDEALQMADAAIGFFRERGSTGDVASNLGRKANILKQMASHLSRSPEPHRARPVIIDAIHAYSESLAITTVGWSEDDETELSAMGTIARRVGVGRRHLSFLDGLTKVDALVSRFLPV